MIFTKLFVWIEFIFQWSSKLLLRSVKSFSNNSSQATQDINYESAIKGTTLEVYFYLLRKKSAVGVREVQRELNL
ncbi:MAG: hypothetical protein ACTSR2_11460, partial [Candidatus Hodarchaeales archaeon]